MGPAGVGKSTFIKNLVGDDAAEIQHDLISKTPEIRAWSIHHAGLDYFLVDTPGFDDSSRNYREVTEQLLQWLREWYIYGMQLHGIIYIHSIMNPEMQGAALQNLRMFQKLCGPKSLKNVILASSFWDQVASNTGTQREEELKKFNEFWGQMIDHGSKLVRLGNRANNLEILEMMAWYRPVVLSAQDEMVHQARPASRTDAARVVDGEVEAEMKHAEMEAKKGQPEPTHQRERERSPSPTGCCGWRCI
ncbi:hypothetical protein ACHAPT_010242 [Fusarium lateritium]